MTATTTTSRTVVFECGDVARFTDRTDGAWTWSAVKPVYTCPACRAHQAQIAQDAQLADLARAMRQPVGDDQLAELAAALTAYVA